MKLSTVFGAFAASSSTTMSPSDVANRTFCAHAGAAAAMDTTARAAAAARTKVPGIDLLLSTVEGCARRAGRADELAGQLDLARQPGVSRLQLQRSCIGLAGEHRVHVAQILVRDREVRVEPQRLLERCARLAVVAGGGMQGSEVV